MVAAAHPVCPIELYSPWPPTHSQPLFTWELIVPSDLTPLKEQRLRGAVSSVSHIESTWTTDIRVHHFNNIWFPCTMACPCVISGTRGPGSCAVSLREWNPHAWRCVLHHTRDIHVHAFLSPPCQGHTYLSVYVTCCIAARGTRGLLCYRSADIDSHPRRARPAFFTVWYLCALKLNGPLHTSAQKALPLNLPC